MMSFFTISILSTLVAVFGPVSGDDLNAALSSGSCSSCVELSLSLLQCADEGGCSMDDCLEGSFEELENGSCCPSCSDEWSAAKACFQECLPDCLYDSVVEYAFCVELRDCQEPCQDKFAAAAEDTTNDVVTKAVDGYELDLSSVGDLGNIGELSTSELTCSTFEDGVSEEVCELANCCPNCIDQFETVTECIINEVIMKELLGSDEVCDVECGDNQIGFEGWQPSVSRNKGKRLLQQQPSHPRPGAEGDTPHFFEYFDTCRDVMAGYFAAGRAAGAYGGYLECLLEQLNKVSAVEKTDDGEDPIVSSSPAFTTVIAIWIVVASHLWWV